ncbi:MAG: hypothetical protein IJ901_04360 [Bacteroidaceae bacterium]|jgi:antitoxin (DNA-binding transcriptional repressor) of toxin-antitoxin stability system|nr:hypothetical protein [Bacteroidaceae bacterium]
MTQLTVRDFRKQMATSLDRVDAGEHVFIRRKNQLYTIIPVNEDELTITPALAAKIEKARQEFREGQTLRFETAAEAQKWMDEL